MGGVLVTGQSLEGAAHIVQLALTPIFLLTGVGQLLNVFTTRLGRVADRARQLRQEGNASRAEIDRLRLRSRVLDVAVLLSTLAGILTCCTAMTLFSGAVRNEDAATLLFWLFGAALGCAIAALAASAVETILSTRTIRETASQAMDARSGLDG